MSHRRDKEFFGLSTIVKPVRGRCVRCIITPGSKRVCKFAGRLHSASLLEIFLLSFPERAQ